MKKFLQVSLLLLSLSSIAQSKFIEVEVQDTITLKPQTLQCNIILSEKEVFAFEDDTDISELQTQEEDNNKLQELKRTLEMKKYIVKPLDKGNLGMMGKLNRDAKGYTVIVNSIAEAETVKETVSKMKNAEVMVTTLTYANEVKAEELLIKKLLDKAKSRAALIGVNSGLKPGRIIEVKEGQPTGGNGMKDFYSEIMKLGNMFGADTGNYNGSLSKTFVVRFAAE
jgi:hypothetical protein